ncbi:MAG: hypothetical protein QM758_12130 [Armatimonas sp.]
MKQIRLAVAALTTFLLSVPSSHGAFDTVTPIVDSTGLLLGGTRGGKWVKAEQVVPQLKGGESYQFYGFSGTPKTYTGSKPELDEASGAAYFIPFKGRPRAEKATFVGLGGSKRGQPRPIRSASTTQPAYLKAVSTVLAKNGIRTSRPNITRILRLDLDGKGEDSVLIEAQSLNFPLMPDTTATNRTNAYSLVMLRTMIRGRLETHVLAARFVKSNKDSNLVEQFTLAPPVDLNGDGVFEIIVESQYYEGGGAMVFALQRGVPKEVLGASAGA